MWEAQTIDRNDRNMVAKPLFRVFMVLNFWFGSTNDQLVNLLCLENWGWAVDFLAIGTCKRESFLHEMERGVELRNYSDNFT